MWLNLLVDDCSCGKITKLKKTTLQLLLSNMAISGKKKNQNQNLATLALFFNKNPLYESLSIYLSGHQVVKLHHQNQVP
jgi:hypothetical protein